MIKDTANRRICKCLFELQSTECVANIKFPCSYFMQWKVSNTHKVSFSDSCYKSVNGKILFKQKLYINTNMVYNVQRQSYEKKQSIITVNLITNSRPNEPKLVGRIVVDLKDVANRTHYQQLMTQSLQYCTVQGALTFKITLKNEIRPSLSQEVNQTSEIPQFSPIHAEEFTDYRQFERQVFKIHNKLNIPNPYDKLKGKQKFVDFVSEDTNHENDDQTNLSKINIHNPNQQSYKQINKITEFMNERNKKINIHHKDLVTPVSLTTNSRHLPRPKIAEIRKSSAQRQGERINSKAKTMKGTYEKASSVTKNLDKYFVNIKSKPETQRQLIKDKYKMENEAIKIQNLSLQRQNRDQQLEIKSLKITNSLLEQELDKLRQIIVKKETQLRSMLRSSVNNPQIQQSNINFLQPNGYLKQQCNLLNLNQQTRQGQLIIQGEKLPHLGNELTTTHQLTNNDPSGVMNDIEGGENIIEQGKSRYNTHTNNSNTPEGQHSLLQQRLNKIIRDQQLTTHKLQDQIRNHEDTKKQLADLRLWYSQLQNDIEKLERQKQQLKHKFQQQPYRQLQFSHRNAYQKHVSRPVDNKQNETDIIQNIQQHFQSKPLKMEIQIKQLKDKPNRFQQNQLTIRNQLKQARKLYDELYTQKINLAQQLAVQKSKSLSFEVELKDLQKVHNNASCVSEQKSEIIIKQQKIIQNLRQILQEKQLQITKIQQDNRYNQVIAQLREVTVCQKRLKEEKLQETEKNKLLQLQLTELRRQIRHSHQMYSMQMQQIKKQYQQKHNKYSDSLPLKSQCIQKEQNDNSQIIIKIAQYKNKQKLYQESILSLETKIRQITYLLEESQQRQFKSTEIIKILNEQNKQLILRLNSLENEYKNIIEINEGLSAEIQILNNYNIQSAQSYSTGGDGFAQFQNIIKNNEIDQKQDEINRLKLKIQELKNSQLTQKQQFQQKLYQLALLNQKLSSQGFSFQDNSNHHTDKQKTIVKELKAEIQYLQSKLSESTDKIDKMTVQSEKDRKIFLQNIDRQNNQVNYYLNQILELKDNLKSTRKGIQQKQLQQRQITAKLQQIIQQKQLLNIQLESLEKLNSQISLKSQQLIHQLAHLKSQKKSTQDQILEQNYQKSKMDCDFLQRIKDYELQISTLKEQIQKITYSLNQELSKTSILQQTDKYQKICLEKLEQQLDKRSKQLIMLQQQRQTYKCSSQQNLIRVNDLEVVLRCKDTEADKLISKIEDLQSQFDKIKYNSQSVEIQRQQFKIKQQAFNTQKQEFIKSISLQQKQIYFLQLQISKLKSIEEQIIIIVHQFKNQIQTKCMNLENQSIQRINDLEQKYKQIQIKLAEIRQSLHQKKKQHTEQLKLQQQLLNYQQNIKYLKQQNQSIREQIQKIKNNQLAQNNSKKIEQYQKEDSNSKNQYLIDLNRILMQISHIINQRKRDDQVKHSLNKTAVKMIQQSVSQAVKNESMQQKIKIMTKEFQKIKTNALRHQSLNAGSKKQIINFFIPLQKFVNEVFGESLAIPNMNNSSKQQNWPTRYTFPAKNK